MTSSEPQPQEVPMQAEPQKEHAWLRKFVGEWTYEGECSMGPDQPKATFTGTENVRAIGDLWVQGQGRGEMPGCGEATTILTLGFDPQRNKFVGSWVGSMMTHMWVYEGTLDEEERFLTLEAEGPDMTNPGKTAVYRDVVERVSDDHRVLRSYGKGPDGEWFEFMTAHYRRKQ